MTDITPEPKYLITLYPPVGKIRNQLKQRTFLSQIVVTCDVVEAQAVLVVLEAVEEDVGHFLGD